MLGIYIHIPFCTKKCSYCDFVSIEDHSYIREYVNALLKEIEYSGKMYRRMVDGIFFGGGTPSLLSSQDMERILDTIYKSFAVDEDTEITVEANPGTLSKRKLLHYHTLGINRLSLGMQSTQPELLKLLGRQHTLKMFEQVYDDARTVGFSNMSVDMMYALPGQTLEHVGETIDFLLQKRPEHISAYALHLEEETPLYQAIEQKEIDASTEELEVKMYHFIQEKLEHLGYTHYEISNFAIEGYECRHNLKYWNLVDYLGIGVAAHSCIDSVRFSNGRDIKEYIHRMNQGQMQYEDVTLLDERNKKIEYLMLKLRLQKGFALYDYQNRFLEDFLHTFEKEVKKVMKYGLLKEEDGRIKPTKKGFDYQNTLVSELIQDI